MQGSRLKLFFLGFIFVFAVHSAQAQQPAVSTNAQQPATSTNARQPATSGNARQPATSGKVQPQTISAKNETAIDTLKPIVRALTTQDSLVMIVPDTTVRKNSQQVDNIISYAKKFLGTPYRSAGMTPSGFDCSGFIFYVMGNFGLTLTHSSYGMAEFGKTVKLADIRPGDLMFFKGSNSRSTRVGHVAMVVEVNANEIKFIHSSTSRGVVIDNFKASKYYIPRYITTKRLDFGVEDKPVEKPALEK